MPSFSVSCQGAKIAAQRDLPQSTMRKKRVISGLEPTYGRKGTSHERQEASHD
jgi:hypothetical protein